MHLCVDLTEAIEWLPILLCIVSDSKDTVTK